MKVGVLCALSMLVACGFEGQGEVEAEPTKGVGDGTGGPSTIVGSVDAVAFGGRLVALLPQGSITAQHPCLERRDIMSKFQGAAGVFNFLLEDVAPGQYELAVARFTTQDFALRSAEISILSIDASGGQIDLGPIALPPPVAPTRGERDRRANWVVPSGFSTSAYKLMDLDACKVGTSTSVGSGVLQTTGKFKIVNESSANRQLAIATVELK